MDSMQAMAMGLASKGNEQRVFDWDRAAALIRERQPNVAAAGLREDWGWTGGDIYRDAKPVEREVTYIYLASTWATPALELDGEMQDCWQMASDVPWDANTFWPESSVAILNAVEGESIGGDDA
jgi:hypothetical protein